MSSMFDSLRYIVNEKITVNGQPLGDDTADGEEEPKYDDDPNQDPAAPDDNGGTNADNTPAEPAPAADATGDAANDATPAPDQAPD